jgi:hypothetical protein
MFPLCVIPESVKWLNINSNTCSLVGVLSLFQYPDRLCGLSSPLSYVFRGVSIWDKAVWAQSSTLISIQYWSWEWFAGRIHSHTHVPMAWCLCACVVSLLRSKLSYKNTVTYSPISKQLLCKQRPLLVNARNMHATIEERRFLCGPRCDRCYTTAPQTHLYSNRAAVFYAWSVSAGSWRISTIKSRC